MVEHYFFAQQLVQLLESFLQSLRLLVEAEVPVEAAAVVLLLLPASEEFVVPSSLSEAEPPPPPAPSSKLRISGLSDTVFILILSSMSDWRPFLFSSLNLKKTKKTLIRHSFHVEYMVT